MGTLSPLAKVFSAPILAVRMVKPLCPVAVWLVAPESTTLVDNLRVLPCALLLPEWPVEAL